MVIFFLVFQNFKTFEFISNSSYFEQFKCWKTRLTLFQAVNLVILGTVSVTVNAQALKDFLISSEDRDPHADFTHSSIRFIDGA
jgi:hypothetical protein